MGVLKNTKWELFAQEILKGETADQAYVNAGYKKNRKNAARLKTNEDIMARIDALKRTAAIKAVVDRAWVLEHLKENALVSMGKMRVKDENGILAETNHNPSAANAALKLLGQELEGMFIDVKKQIDDDGKAVVPVINVTIGTES